MSDSDEAEVRSAFDRLLAAINTGDVDTLRSLMSEEPGSTHIGTEASEWWTTEEFLAAGKGANVSQDVTAEATDVNVHVKGDVAWFEGKGLFKNSAGGQRDIRVTGVFVREPDGTWKGAQSHASIAVPNDQIFAS